MEQPTHIYIGTKTCGCITVAISDMPEFKKETAKAVAECIRDGYDVQRIPVEEFRERGLGKCTHGKTAELFSEQP